MQSTSRRLCTLTTRRLYQSSYRRHSAGITSPSRTSTYYRKLPPYRQMSGTMHPDPNRPDLFYHLVNPPTPLSKSRFAFALSFLRVTPPGVDSATILGWLPAETYLADVPEPGMDWHAPKTQKKSAGLRDFVENPKFVTLLHETIQSALSENIDEIWENGAMQLQEGWMHIHDQRNIPALGRIGDPDDIIASVLVEKSKIKAETYQPMPSYRICTADGVLQLTPGLAKELNAVLIQVTNAEDAKAIKPKSFSDL